MCARGDGVVCQTESDLSRTVCDVQSHITKTLVAGFQIFDLLPVVKFQFRRQFWNVQALTHPFHLVSSGYVAKNSGTWLGYVMGIQISDVLTHFPWSKFNFEDSFGMFRL